VRTVVQAAVLMSRTLLCRGGDRLTVHPGPACPLSSPQPAARDPEEALLQ
jgi:hypothetical protein